MIKESNDQAVALKSDVYYVFQTKEPNIDELLAPTNATVLAEEARLDALDKEIAERRKIFEAEMDKVDNDILKEKESQKALRKRFKENKIGRNKMEAELSYSKIKDLFQENKDYILKIFSGELYSERRDAFIKGGIHRDSLREKMIVPFSEDQHSAIMDELSNIWMRNYKESMENSEFIWKVILPETFIKVTI
jgi:TPP-dependent indolepyruvate ferredoxin oxidoreductase alpha subunit